MRANSTCFCSPPDSEPARSPARSRQIGKAATACVQPRRDDLGILDEVAAHEQVVPDRHRREQAALLRYVRDAQQQPRLRAEFVDLAIAIDDAATARTQESADRLEQRRLARAVGTDEARDRARLDVQVDALEDVSGAVAGHHTVESQDRSHAANSRGRHRGRCGLFCTAAGEPEKIGRPGVEYHDRIAQPHHEGHVVLDDQEGGPGGVPVADVVLHRLDHDRVDSGGGLVEQHQLRLAHQHGRELQQFALPVGQLRGRGVGHRGESELGQQMLGPFPVGPPDPAAEQAATGSSRRPPPGFPARSAAERLGLAGTCGTGRGGRAARCHVR